jgi:hypothetical protein
MLYSMRADMFPVDQEKEKHHVDVELIHGFKPARMFIPVVPSIYSEGH